MTKHTLFFGTIIGIGCSMLGIIYFSGKHKVDTLIIKDTIVQKKVITNKDTVYVIQEIIREKIPEKEGLSKTKSIQKVQSVPLKENWIFASEPVPLSDLDVVERLDRELHVNTYWHSNTILTLKLSKKYFPIIEPILKANGVPDDFKFVALAESGLRDVVSPAGAASKWQIMKATAQEYGLEVNQDIDERYHLEKSTQAACDYFKEAYQAFGNWTLVAASYNMGIAGLKRNLEKQKVHSYYDLLLNAETARYVFRILAFKEIYNNALKYGFHLDEKDGYKYENFVTVSCDSSISDLAQYAKDLGSNYKSIKRLNGWLRSNQLPNKRQKNYLIKVPQ